MDPKDPLFFKLPICARATTQLYRIYSIPANDCKIDWKKLYSDDITPIRLYFIILQNSDVKDIPKFHYFDLICLHKCGYGFIKEFLTTEEILYLIKIGREDYIKGLTEEEKAHYRQIAFPTNLFKDRRS